MMFSSDLPNSAQLATLALTLRAVLLFGYVVASAVQLVDVGGQDRDLSANRRKSAIFLLISLTFWAITGLFALPVLGLGIRVRMVFSAFNVLFEAQAAIFLLQRGVGPQFGAAARRGAIVWTTWVAGFVSVLAPLLYTLNPRAGLSICAAHTIGVSLSLVFALRLPRNADLMKAGPANALTVGVLVSALNQFVFVFSDPGSTRQTLSECVSLGAAVLVAHGTWRLSTMDLESAQIVSQPFPAWKVAYTTIAMICCVCFLCGRDSWNRTFFESTQRSARGGYSSANEVDMMVSPAASPSPVRRSLAELDPVKIHAHELSALRGRHVALTPSEILADADSPEELDEKLDAIYAMNPRRLDGHAVLSVPADAQA